MKPSLLGAALRASVCIITASTSAGCAVKLDTSTEPAPIMVEDSAAASVRLTGVPVSVAPVLDARTPAPAADFQKERQETTTSRIEAGADAQKAVEEALSRALPAAASGAGGAPVTVQTEIRDWHSTVHAAATGKIESTATLAVQTLRPDGTTVYSGVYNGSRASSFPIVAKQDVQESLSLAMGEAISQLLKDRGFLQSLKDATGRSSY